MAKASTYFFCQNCGARSPKWLGKCPSCGEWNTYVEEVVQKETSERGQWKQGTTGVPSRSPRPKRLAEVDLQNQERIPTQDAELDRVLGGGIVPGSIVLIGGEPGIGKSTLLLQIALQLRGLRILYVSGEESEQQIRLRAERLPYANPDCYVLAETQTQNIFKQVEELEPQLLIIDSIQTLQSAFVESGPGSVSQVRECTAELMKFAKETGTPVFIIGHITKDGALAGPKVLEHMVDTVLQFEGDRHLTYRILRTSKNRYGSTSELGLYEMRSEGLVQVENPSEILLNPRSADLSGVAIASMLEGNRPLMIEIQSLVSAATYGTPQRSSTGFDGKRLQMLLAVLEKRGGYRLGGQDVFLNVAGGLKVEDPALDLAVCASLVSSYEDLSFSRLTCFAGEVGLGGEVRAVNRIEQRISEAARLGFQQMFISQLNTKGLDYSQWPIRIVPVSQVQEMLDSLLNP